MSEYKNSQTRPFGEVKAITNSVENAAELQMQKYFRQQQQFQQQQPQAQPQQQQMQAGTPEAGGPKTPEA